MQTFTKPLAARQVEARSRARAKGVRVAVVFVARSYVSISQSQPGITYRIERDRHGWGCECDGFRFTGMCKHVAPLDRTAPGVSTVDTPPSPTPIIPFPQPGTRHTQSEAARRANEELFGA